MQPIKWILPQEMKQVNDIYQSLSFEPSKMPPDEVAKLTDQNQIIGLGRIVHHEPGVQELGGIWIHESRRGYAYSSQIIRWLLDHCIQDQPVWCVPFESLTNYYQQFGFQEVTDEVVVPDGIKSRMNLCASEQSQPVRCMILNPK